MPLVVLVWSLFQRARAVGLIGRERVLQRSLGGGLVQRWKQRACNSTQAELVALAISDCDLQVDLREAHTSLLAHIAYWHRYTLSYHGCAFYTDSAGRTALIDSGTWMYVYDPAHHLVLLGSIDQAKVFVDALRRREGDGALQEKQRMGETTLAQ